jgi:pSer/pThr/pTyr-binding forkhead associated (FHA) protein
MSDNTTPTKKSFSLDWLIRGVLTKFGDVFDSLTGRRWKPSSSLATSELIERLKKLLDLEVKDLGEKGKFVPHNLKLKMQWDKFSTDAENALKSLQTELLIAAVDHINDNRYQTYEPLNLEVKPDYFTEGVKLTASFDKVGKEENEAVVNVTVPEIKVGDFIPQTPTAEIEPGKENFTFNFTVGGKSKEIKLEFTQGKRRSVGRNKQNDLMIDDTSVSKIHAALILNRENQFQVADTGSTNGTFINEQRIAYGKAVTISDTDKIKFGTIEVSIKKEFRPIPVVVENISADKTEQLPNSEQLISQANLTSNDLETRKNSNELVTNKDVSPATEKNIQDENANATQQGIVFDFENQTSGNQK